MNFDEMVRRLQASKGTGAWQDVATLAGLPYDTVAKLARGYIRFPTVQNVEKVSAALLKLKICEPKRKGKS